MECNKVNGAKLSLYLNDQVNNYRLMNDLRYILKYFCYRRKAMNLIGVIITITF